MSRTYRRRRGKPRPLWLSKWRFNSDAIYAYYGFGRPPGWFRRQIVRCRRRFNRQRLQAGLEPIQYRRDLDWLWW